MTKTLLEVTCWVQLARYLDRSVPSNDWIAITCASIFRCASIFFFFLANVERLWQSIFFFTLNCQKVEKQPNNTGLNFFSLYTSLLEHVSHKYNLRSKSLCYRRKNKKKKKRRICVVGKDHVSVVSAHSKCFSYNAHWFAHAQWCPHDESLRPLDYATALADEQLHRLESATKCFSSDKSTLTTSLIIESPWLKFCTLLRPQGEETTRKVETHEFDTAKSGEGKVVIAEGVD